MPQNVDRYRDIAEEYRTLGDTASEPQVKEIYYGIAREYDRLVARAEEVMRSDRLVGGR
jgi:hypothetical protein